MKILQNQRGYTLVLVLLSVIILFLFGMVLIGANLNFANQLKSTNHHYLAINLAENGIEYGEARIHHQLETLEIEEILTRENSQLNKNATEINTIIGENIIRSIPENNGETGFTINIALAEVTEDKIVFGITSIGGDKEYKITANLEVATDISVSPGTDGGTGGSTDEDEDIGEFDDPSDFQDFHSVAGSIRQIVNGAAVTNRPGETFSGVHVLDESPNFQHSITLEPGTSFTIKGTTFLRGLTANNVDKIDIEGAVFIDSGPNAINGVHTFNIGRHFGSSQPLNITSSTLTVEGDVAVQNRLTLQNSTATLNGFTALNTLQINDSTMKTNGIRPSEIQLTNADLLVRGGFRLEWGGGSMENSTLTVLGNFLGESPIRLNSQSTLVIHGNANFTAWSPIQFTGNGSRIIIFGESNRNSWGGLDANILLRDVDTLEEAVVIDNANVIYFVKEDPPTNTDDGSGGNEGEDGETTGEINIIFGDIHLRNVQYVG